MAGGMYTHVGTINFPGFSNSSQNIVQRRYDYRMETNPVQHSGNFYWKVNFAKAENGVLISDSFSPNAMCRTNWKMIISFANPITKEMILRVRRTDLDGDSLFVNIHLKLRNFEGVEFKEESIKDFKCESGSEWELTFQKPCQIMTAPTGDHPIIHEIEDREFFIKGIIEVKECCPETKIFGVREFEGDPLTTRNPDVSIFHILRSCEYEHACYIDWKIKNFSLYKHKIVSPVFAPINGCKSRWKVAITFITGDVEQMRVSIERVDDEQIKGLPAFSLTLKNSRKVKFYEEKVEEWISKDWGIISRRPSRAQPVWKPDGSALFQLDKDDMLLITVLIILSRCCGYIPNPPILDDFAIML